MSNVDYNRRKWRNSEVVRGTSNGRNDYRGNYQNSRQGNQWFDSRNRFQNDDRRFNDRGYQFRNRGQNDDFSRGDQRNRDSSESFSRGSRRQMGRLNVLKVSEVQSDQTSSANEVPIKLSAICMSPVELPYVPILLNETFTKINRGLQCKFGCDELKYLGLIINKEGIKTDETKVRAIVEMKPPRNSKVSKFLEAQKAFDAVKAAITKVPVLKLPDFKKPFVLFTDASSRCRVAAVAEWYRYRTVACFVTGSSPVPLKTRRVHVKSVDFPLVWCGRRGGASSGVVHVT
ncbi:uncharacterized protein TNCV_2326041 [Trichonephila clavipes]|nr:uncharacterized protein TNCV_2326041 [Trichonephila clavipes]